MRSKGHHIMNYADDLLGLENLGQPLESYRFLRQLLERAGFPIRSSNLDPPSTRCICLGLMIDTEAESVKIPSHKLKRI